MRNQKLALRYKSSFSSFFKGRLVFSLFETSSTTLKIYYYVHQQFSNIYWTFLKFFNEECNQKLASIHIKNIKTLYYILTYMQNLSLL